MDRKNDGPIRMCVATHAMLATAKQKNNSGKNTKGLFQKIKSFVVFNV